MGHPHSDRLFRSGAIALAVVWWVVFGAHAQTLSVVAHDYRGAKVTDRNAWAVLDLRNVSGQPVTGMDLSQVTLRESLVDAVTGAQITTPAEVGLAANSYYSTGLWEKTVGETKLDITFMVDRTGSMDPAMPAIRSEVHEFIDALIANHVDFRVSAVSFEETPVHLSPCPFYGPLEIEKLREEIDNTFNAGGDWWSPTVAYDAVMNALWGGFRDDAHRVVVVITDIAPQTIYGTFWYAGGCTASTLSGMEFFLRAHEIHLFFSHDASTSGDPNYEYYCNPEINPRAGINESGFEALAKKNDAFGRPLAVSLGWPFQQENLQSAIRQRVATPSLFLTPLPILESVYVVSWESGLEWHDVPGTPGDVLYRADISVTVPGTKTTHSTFCTYPVQKTRTPVTITVSDEHGNPQDDSWSYLEPLMIDRPMDYYFYQLTPTDGQVFLPDVPIGHYLLSVTDGGHSYSYDSLRGMNYARVEISASPITIDAVMTTIDKEADLARTRGLLKDLADWRSPGDPFQDFADDANAWLDALAADGVTWEELVQVKRFEIALSGYAAITEYAHLQTEGAIEDFHKILMDFIAIIQETEDLHDSVKANWEDAVIEILATIVDILITHGEFTANRELLEAALDALIEYAQTELITDLKTLVNEQIPAGPYKPLITAMMYTCLDAKFEDWTPVMEAARDLALHLAKKEIIDTLAENIVDTMFEDLDVNDPMEQAVEGLVHALLEAMVSEGEFDSFDEALKQFSQDIGTHVLQGGTDSRAEVVAAVESLFEKIQAQLPPSTFRDFLIGMTRDLALQAIPEVEAGSLKYDIDSDAVVKILVRHALYNVVLKDYYADNVKSGLYQTLYRAQAYIPEGVDRDDYENAMHSDFWSFRGDVVAPVQDVAWNALSLQNDIDNWAEALEGLGSALEAVNVPLAFFANVYPPLEDTSEEVDDFVNVLDGLQIVTRALEFGLKLDCLNTLSNRAVPMYETLFPMPAEDVYLMGVTPVEHDFGETKATWGAMICPVTVWNAGNQTLNISTMTLADTKNFSFVEPAKTLSPAIEPGHSHTVHVKFDPTCTGEFETTLTVYCGMTDPPQKAITLKGVGTYLDRGVAGDANSDMLLNAVDVQLVINAALGIVNYAHTDLNNDGKHNAVDVQLIINAVLSL